MKMLRRLALTALLAAPGLLPPVLAVAVASTAEPVEVVRDTTERLFAALGQASEPDADRAAALAEQIVSPRVDYERVTRLVLGRHWEEASEGQRRRFTAEFRDLLVRSYADVVVKNRDAKVQYGPARPPNPKGEATVSTKVGVQGQPPVRIDYRLHREGGTWKVFDIVVEGASLVSTHRTTFSQRIREKGIDALIDELAAKNAAA